MGKSKPVVVCHRLVSNGKDRKFRTTYSFKNPIHYVTIENRTRDSLAFFKSNKRKPHSSCWGWVGDNFLHYQREIYVIIVFSVLPGFILTVNRTWQNPCGSASDFSASGPRSVSRWYFIDFQCWPIIPRRIWDLFKIK